MISIVGGHDLLATPPRHRDSDSRDTVLACSSRGGCGIVDGVSAGPLARRNLFGAPRLSEFMLLIAAAVPPARTVAGVRGDTPSMTRLQTPPIAQQRSQSTQGRLRRCQVAANYLSKLIQVKRDVRKRQVLCGLRTELGAVDGQLTA